MKNKKSVLNVPFVTFFAEKPTVKNFSGNIGKPNRVVCGSGLMSQDILTEVDLEQVCEDA